ncbi:MAG TPA: Ig-like domain-containing protein [Gemmatimonadales bacterium]|nr:Ig-like domain-containing protein [Gemmatimonadales bacterium]
MRPDTSKGTVGLLQRPSRIARYGIRTAIVAGLVWLAACPHSITESAFVLSVAPPSANLFVNDNLQLTATLKDQSGNPVAATFAWTSDNPSVASVDATGLVHGLAAGSAKIVAAAQGQEAVAVLTVKVDSGQTLTIAPTAASLSIGGTQRFIAVLKDHNGGTMPATPQWSSNNQAVASVDANGLATASSAGSATIQARAHNLVASAAVTVSSNTGGSVLVGAGDIATCTNQNDSATAKIIDGISGAVFTAGDNAYPNGSATDYANCYGPTWGRFKSRTHPAPGNHEYNTAGAPGYFGYFGSAAGDPSKGYYSYDYGGWHIIVVNSNLDRTAGSPQEQWLRADLASNHARCTLAYWHYPRFSSGNTHGSDVSMQPIWQALYDFGADVVISGHEHVYERFAPQTPNGQLDASKGIREFVVGTGGAGNYTFGAPQPNSEVRYNATAGVIKLTLYADHYDWQFIPTSGSFTDSGSGSCH